MLNGRWTPSAGVAAVIGALLIFNLANNWLLAWATPVTRPLEVVLLLLLARGFGLTWDELGLARSTWARGLRWGVAGLGVVAVCFAVAFAVPALRVAFLDQRGHLSVGAAIVEAAVGVFIGTVLLEELAFRGVLWALLCRVRGPAYATLLSSVAFGLWHVLPALGIRDDNRAVGDLAGTGSAAGAVVVVLSVAATAAAGVLFCELRRRSGSLLAPIGLHWATNGLGYVFAALAWAGR